MISNNIIKLVKPSLDLAVEFREALIESYHEHCQFLEWAKPNPSYEDVRENMQNSVNNFKLGREELRFIIQRVDDDRIVGCVGLHLRNMSIPYFEIGYWARTADTGKGYITQAVNLLESYAIDEFNVKRLEVKMAATNIASKRVAEKAGFSYEATIQSDRLLPSGKKDSTHIYCKIF